MNKIVTLIIVLTGLAVGLFAYGTIKDPGKGFILSRLIIAPQEEEREEPTALIFVGDMMLTRGVGVSIWNNGGGDSRYPFLNIADTLRKADLTIGNLEGPVSSRGENVGSIYSFRHPVERVDGLTFSGFDVLSLANNHIWDYGPIALGDTLDILRGAGISPVGAGRNFKEANSPIIKDVKGTKIAFFSYTNLYPSSLWAGGAETLRSTKGAEDSRSAKGAEDSRSAKGAEDSRSAKGAESGAETGDESPGISTPTIQNISASISKIRDQVDLVVVLWHWGEEYEGKSHSRDQQIARLVIDAGADLIVGTHPHVTQEIETYKGKTIAYSLGNFIFDQSFSKDTMRGYLLNVVIRNKKIVSVVPFPIKISNTFQPELGWQTWALLQSMPFKKTVPAVKLVEGFAGYEGVLGDTPGDVHRGIDFALEKDEEFLPFEVFSMNNGSAMKGDSETWGEFVMVRNQLSPTLRYYTIYSHLSDIPEKFRDIRSVAPGGWAGATVNTGEFLGMAGVSGNTKGVAQLHIELQEHDLETDQWLKIDPYGLYEEAGSGSYPQPGEPLDGLDHYWTTNNPQFIR